MFYQNTVAMFNSRDDYLVVSSTYSWSLEYMFLICQYDLL